MHFWNWQRFGFSHWLRTVEHMVVVRPLGVFALKVPNDWTDYSGSNQWSDGWFPTVAHMLLAQRRLPGFWHIRKALESCPLTTNVTLYLLFSRYIKYQRSLQSSLFPKLSFFSVLMLCFRVCISVKRQVGIINLLLESTRAKWVLII